MRSAASGSSPLAHLRPVSSSRLLHISPWTPSHAWIVFWLLFSQGATSSPLPLLVLISQRPAQECRCLLYTSNTFSQCFFFSSSSAERGSLPHHRSALKEGVSCLGFFLCFLQPRAHKLGHRARWNLFWIFGPILAKWGGSALSFWISSKFA